MFKAYSCLTQQHDIRLVLLAGAICLFASLTAFMLASHMRVARPRRRMPWLVALGFVAGTGIWATHFLAMLAYDPGLPIAYEPGLTALSIVISIGMCTLAFTRGVMMKAVLLTCGIAAMHFTGMAALQTTGRVVYDPLPIIVSMAAGGGLVLLGIVYFDLRTRRVAIVPALLFTVAICTIHFGAMVAASIVPDNRAVIDSGAISSNGLATVVATLVVALLGIAFATIRLEMRLSHNAMQEADRLKSFSECSLEGLLILDGDTIADANGMFWRMAGRDPDAPPCDLPVSSVLPDHLVARRAGEGFRETLLHRSDGTALEVETAIPPCPASASGRGREMIVLRDITGRKEAAARIAHLASHDPLTGAANRLSFNDALADAISAAEAAHPLALLCIDLDRFKQVNDLYGHPVGDGVLVEVTRRVQSCLAKGQTLARLGGDEFVVVMPDCGGIGGPGVLAERIIDRLSAPYHLDGISLTVGASIGIALCPTDATDGPDLHKRADLALYRAKAEGRGLFRFFDHMMDHQVVERHRMEAELRGALARDQFSIVYQPLACLDSGGILGFEALLRWHHPTLGEVSPARFIPLAEESGLIVPIGEWVLREACREAARWSPALRVAVNLSPVQFAAGDLVATVHDVLTETGLDPTRLDLEITEGLLIKDADKALAVLTRLKALGVSIAMDDFGTGYSSLSYFRQFPFDKVKIDQSFVRDMAANPQALAIVKAVIGLGRGLGMSVLAEGVETSEQMALLQQEGCGQMQGYLISRPQPIACFDGVVLDRARLPFAAIPASAEAA